MPDSPELKSFRRHFNLAERLIDRSTKEEVAEVARLLAINCAHYQFKFGERLLEQTIDLASEEKPDPKTAKVLSEGMRALCGVLAYVTGDAGPDSQGH